MFHNVKPEVPHTQVHRVARRLLEPAQDLLVLGIGLALFGFMVRTLIWLFRAIIVRGDLDYRGVIAQVLFMLVMVEVVRLVIIYLEEHRIAVQLARRRCGQPPTPAQGEAVKDRLCYKRPTIMYEGFTQQNPWLSAEQKADIKNICDDAREVAMDGGSSTEKHKIMDKYKGRLTNYIARAKKAAATEQSAGTQAAK